MWRNTLTGDTWIWLMNGNSIKASGRVAIVDLSWTMVGVGDFNGLGRRDIVWYNAPLGQVSIWTTKGLTETGSYDFPRGKKIFRRLFVGWQDRSPEVAQQKTVNFCRKPPNLTSDL